MLIRVYVPSAPVTDVIDLLAALPMLTPVLMPAQEAKPAPLERWIKTKLQLTHNLS